MSHQATARLFIALELPDDLREELSAWARYALRAAAACPPQPHPRESRGGRRHSHHAAGRMHGIRTLSPDLLHITMSFLGSRPVEEIEPLSALVESCVQPAMGKASIGAPLWLPTRRPRALAVEVHDDSGALDELHRTILGDLSAAGLASTAPTHGAGHRAFRPHVTVARLRQGAAPRERTLEPTPRRAFTPQRLVLYRSWLSSEGASYEPLARATAAPASASASS